MKLKNTPPLQTVLSDARELTDEEKRELASEWANRTWEELLAYADSSFDFSFQKRLCKDIVDKYGDDDKLSSIISSRLRDKRKGKSRGRHTEWDKARYQHLLMVYNISISQGRKRQEVLENLAKMEGLTGDNVIKKIEDRITTARKKIDQSKFSKKFQPPNLRKKGG